MNIEPAASENAPTDQAFGAGRVPASAGLCNAGYRLNAAMIRTMTAATAPAS